MEDLHLYYQMNRFHSSNNSIMTLLIFLYQFYSLHYAFFLYANSEILQMHIFFHNFHKDKWNHVTTQPLFSFYVFFCPFRLFLSFICIFFNHRNPVFLISNPSFHFYQLHDFLFPREAIGCIKTIYKTQNRILNLN